MLALEPHPEGTILPVRAQPGARRNEIRGVQDGMLKVCVTQSPEKGKANKAMVELLSKSLGLKKSQFELIAGETSHQKRFLVRGIKPEELAARVAHRRQKHDRPCFSATPLICFTQQDKIPIHHLLSDFKGKRFLVQV